MFHTILGIVSALGSGSNESVVHKVVLPDLEEEVVDIIANDTTPQLTTEDWVDENGPTLMFETDLVDYPEVDDMESGSGMENDTIQFDGYQYAHPMTILPTMDTVTTSTTSLPSLEPFVLGNEI